MSLEFWGFIFLLWGYIRLVIFFLKNNKRKKVLGGMSEVLDIGLRYEKEGLDGGFLSYNLAHTERG